MERGAVDPNRFRFGRAGLLRLCTSTPLAIRIVEWMTSAP